MAIEKVYVVPAAGMKLRHPSKLAEQLPESGAFWPNDSFTRRRITEGSIKLAPPPAKPSAAPEQPARKSKPDAASE